VTANRDRNGQTGQADSRRTPPDAPRSVRAAKLADPFRLQPEERGDPASGQRRAGV